ncbi:YpmS family protein [Oceanobacillus bengalensis]|uniref:DUF2140 family protein n=1 Tax=Oceanobacillus bengalensis TaxID=1435466 RepID=A0A494Z064_9BACI|nr:YpmS family protein [Oceanobacillus bengalensis]RKQ15875.1 DUF2140 family protein [Oceanobacillus bengalensis]
MSTRKVKRKGEKQWRRLFYSLLFINIAVIIVLALLIFWPVQDIAEQMEYEQVEQESSEFVVRTTKQNLNELVNAYLEQLLEGSRHHYMIELDQDVHLMGELPVFSTTVPLSVHLEPFVQENGDIILKQRSISIGLLALPNQKIMEYMGKYLEMPEWVSINAEDEEIYVAVTQIEMQSNFKVAVEHIDLEANNLAFRFEVPFETLGINQMDAE